MTNTHVKQPSYQFCSTFDYAIIGPNLKSSMVSHFKLCNRRYKKLTTRLFCNYILTNKVSFQDFKIVKTPFFIFTDFMRFVIEDFKWPLY